MPNVYTSAGEASISCPATNDGAPNDLSVVLVSFVARMHKHPSV
jgi:hypothetical protein